MDNRQKGKASSSTSQEDDTSSQSKDDEFSFPAPNLSSNTASRTSRTGTSTSTIPGTSSTYTSPEEILHGGAIATGGATGGSVAGATGGGGAGATGGGGGGERGSHQLPPGTALLGTIRRGKGHVRSMSAAPNGILYTGSDSKKIRVWNKGEHFIDVKSWSGPVNAIVQGPQARIFSAHNDGAIRVWQIDPVRPGVYTQVTTLQKLKERVKNSVSLGRDIRVSCLSLSDDLSYIYSGSYDGTVKAWRLSDLELVDSIRTHKGKVTALGTTPGGVVYSGSRDGTIKVRVREVVYSDNGVFKVRHTLREVLNVESEVNAVVHCTTDAGTCLLYAGLSDGTVRCWKKVSRKVDPEFMFHHMGAVTCLTVSSGPLVFSGSTDGTVCVWRRETNAGFHFHTVAMVLKGHGGPVGCLVAHNDWEVGPTGVERWILYSGALDRTIKIWRVVDQPPLGGGRDREEGWRRKSFP